MKVGAQVRNTTSYDILPSKPMQNAFVESVTGRLLDEDLNEHIFSSRATPNTSS